MAGAWLRRPGSADIGGKPLLSVAPGTRMPGPSVAWARLWTESWPGAGSSWWIAIDGDPRSSPMGEQSNSVWVMTTRDWSLASSPGIRGDEAGGRWSVLSSSRRPSHLPGNSSRLTALSEIDGWHSVARATISMATHQERSLLRYLEGPIARVVAPSLLMTVSGTRPRGECWEPGTLMMHLESLCEATRINSMTATAQTCAQ